MTGTEFKQIFRKLDEGKMDLLRRGFAFDFVGIDRNGDFFHAGIGTAEDMTRLSLISLYDLYRGGKKEGVTPEDFAEGVKRSLALYIRCMEREREAGS